MVIGAGPAGLAVGACLRRSGVEAVLLERAGSIAPAWRRHYDRLHLHTDRTHSSLPFLEMPSDYPRYPSREQVVAYLEAYARDLSPAPLLGQDVRSVRPEGGAFEVSTGDRRWRARAVVLATGYAAAPVRPSWPGMDAYGGTLLHSRDYRNGAPFRGRDVLVVGFGNSGGEIAVDLAEHGARPAIAVRSPVNVLPRDLLGLPVLTWAIALARLPTAVADAIAAPLVRASVGDVTRLGLRKAAEGPLASVRTRARIPLIDVGTLALVRAGRIAVRPGVARFREDGVAFDDGRAERFDAVVLATGYRPDVARLLPSPDGALDGEGRPRRSGGEIMPGLFACGFHVAPTGMLREIAREARGIAAAIAVRLGVIRRGAN